jgi:predicted ribonuclease YlaK
MTQREPLDLGKISVQEFPLVKKLDRGQEDMVVKLYRSRRVIVDAAAGSGKTSVLTQAMKVLLDKGYISTIYYVVFPVQEKSLGHMPGGIDAKIREYAIPFVQALSEVNVQVDEAVLADMCNPLVHGQFKVVPHTFLRGRTIDDAGVIIDETQNGTIDEIRKTLTRVTDSSYVGLVGHNGQIDIKPENSGFSAAIRHFSQGVESGEFTGVEFAELCNDYRGDFSKFADKLGRYE